MSRIEFRVPGEPQGKGRARVGRTNAGHVRMLTPEKTVAYESLIGLSAAQAMAGAPLMLGAVEMRIDLDFGVPASFSKRKRADALSGVVRPTKKPDADNSAKVAADALNGVVYRDDAQIVGLLVLKQYAETPGMRVVVNEIAPA